MAQFLYGSMVLAYPYYQIISYSVVSTDILIFYENSSITIYAKLHVTVAISNDEARDITSYHCIISGLALHAASQLAIKSLDATQLVKPCGQNPALQHTTEPLVGDGRIERAHSV